MTSAPSVCRENIRVRPASGSIRCHAGAARPSRQAEPSSNTRTTIPATAAASTTTAVGMSNAIGRIEDGSRLAADGPRTAVASDCRK